MKDWLDSIPTEKLLDTFQALKDELTEHYREELKLLTERRFLTGEKRAEFYEKEKEIVMKLILLAGGYEVTQIMHECWLVARSEYPMSRAYGPCYLLLRQDDTNTGHRWNSNTILQNTSRESMRVLEKRRKIW